jgi:hypothetical protein
MKDLELFFLFLILGLKLAHQRANRTDVIGKRNAAESLNKDEENSLNISGGNKVTKADCEHDIRAPIIPPDILDKPALIYNVHDLVPVLFLIVMSRHKI